MYRHHIPATDMCEKGADGDLRRGDGDINAATLHQVHISAAVDECNHLASTHTLGQQR